MYHINEISKLINGKIIGEDNLEFSKLSPFFEADPEDLTFAADESMLKNIAETKAEAVIVPVMEEYPDGKTYIVLEQNPRNVLPILLNFFKPKMQKPEKQIESSAKIGANAMIGLNSYIGHNVEIGENTVIAAQSGVAGSSKIGKQCVLAGQVGISGHIEIADGCVFGAQTGVPNNVKEPNSIMQGYPAVPVGTFRRASVVYKNLPELQRTIHELKKQVEELKAGSRK